VATTSRSGVRAALDAIEELGVPVGFHPTGQSSLRDDIAHRFLDHPNGRVIGGAGRNPMELMLAFASLAAGACSNVTPGCAAPSSRARAAGSPWWLCASTRPGRSSAPARRCRSPHSRASTSSGSATSRRDADEKVLRHVVDAVGDDNIVVSTD